MSNQPNAVYEAVLAAVRDSKLSDSTAHRIASMAMHYLRATRSESTETTNAAPQEPLGESPGSGLKTGHEQNAPRGAPVRDVPAEAALSNLIRRLRTFATMYAPDADTPKAMLEAAEALCALSSAGVDITQRFWLQILKAANESPWMPEDYCMNDWVADVCRFLTEPRAIPSASRPTWKQQDADMLAAAVDAAIRRGALDARSEIADCRLDYGQPFTPEEVEQRLSKRRHGKNQSYAADSRSDK